MVLPPRPPEPEVKTPEVQELVFGRSVGGRPITGEVHGSGQQTILILATIHGNESIGTPLVRRLGAYLSEHPELLQDKRVILVPVVNPDGLVANRRGNLRGVDLNRNFPAWNYSAAHAHGAAPLSEPESRVVYDLIDKYEPDRIISIHQPLTCVDYDGPADALARAMATSSRLPFKRLGSLAGSLGSYAGVTRRIPIVTVEFARSADALGPEALWSRYGHMLLLAVCYPETAPSITASSVTPDSAAPRSTPPGTLGN
jgi:protein MpaA